LQLKIFGPLFNNSGVVQAMAQAQNKHGEIKARRKPCAHYKEQRMRTYAHTHMRLFIFRGSRGGRNRNGFSLNIPVLQGAGHRFAYHQYKYHHVHRANHRNLSSISIASRSKITRDAEVGFALLNARSICTKSRAINDYIADDDLDIGESLFTKFASLA